MDYFTLLGLEANYAISLSHLENSFRQLQSEFHPDRFVTAAPADKLKSLQIATQANEAYTTLKSPAKRAAYLLELQGITAIAESNTDMPADFLMQQFEWREQLEEAKQEKNIAAITCLSRELKAKMQRLQADFAEKFDSEKDYETAAIIARKLIFIDKVDADIKIAIEQLD